MKIFLKYFAILFFAFIIFVPAIAEAHQPRLVRSNNTMVNDPETSKAYYGRLTGAPQTFFISAKTPFVLYVNILVPDIIGQPKDVSAIITKYSEAENSVLTLDGPAFKWTRFWEPFGRDWYWQGPEYRQRAGAGQYEIKVRSINNDSKYSLAIGEVEAFDFNESVNALNLIPILKKNFFNESPIGFILSPFGYGYIIIIYLIALALILFARAIIKRNKPDFLKDPNDPNRLKSLKKSTRLILALLGLALLFYAISTTWNPFLLLLSGLGVVMGLSVIFKSNIVSTSEIVK